MLLIDVAKPFLAGVGARMCGCVGDAFRHLQRYVGVFAEVLTRFCQHPKFCSLGDHVAPSWLNDQRYNTNVRRCFCGSADMILSAPEILCRLMMNVCDSMTSRHYKDRYFFLLKC